MTFTPASYREGWQGQLDTVPGMTVAVWQQRPESLGTVCAVSGTYQRRTAVGGEVGFTALIS